MGQRERKRDRERERLRERDTNRPYMQPKLYFWYYMVPKHLLVWSWNSQALPYHGASGPK